MARQPPHTGRGNGLAMGRAPKGASRWTSAGSRTEREATPRRALTTLCREQPIVTARKGAPNRAPILNNTPSVLLRGEVRFF
jgi:hypothetical protein